MKIFALLITITACLLSFSAQASSQNELSLSQWKDLPIIYEGRLKPIDSVSVILLEKISGKKNIRGLSANEWLVEALFDPSKAMERDIFYVADITAINTKENPTRYINYMVLATIINQSAPEISQLLDVNEAQWSQDQAQFMTLYQNYILFTQLLRSMTSVLPLPMDLGADNNYATYLDLKRDQESIDQTVKQIIKDKGMDPTSYTKDELSQSAASFQLNVIEQAGLNNVLLRVIPTRLNGQDGANTINWVSPWDMLLNGKGTPEAGAYLSHWKDMAAAYQEQNKKNWNTAVNNAQVYIQLLTEKDIIKNVKIESFFNILPYKEIALWLYGLCMAVAVFSKTKQGAKTRVNWAKIIQFSFIGALISHIIFIGFRILILERPPVGTLYESLLFVSLICALVMITASWRQHIAGKIQSLVIGALSAFILLFISYGLKDTNSMPTLVAVLNTNFWLTIHVLSITVGYGFCLLAGCLAHFYLYAKIKSNDTAAVFKQTFVISIFALLFTTVGTILGGIWADQSWGRFWGWDPKENGALLIVLWLIWLIHSRISGHLKEFGFMVGMAFINIVVILAWFGVNLLSVGLHSYGFIEGIAASIALFCATEIIAISTLAYLARRSPIQEKVKA